ncbi:MAG: XrtA/PEP-CTERM system histidine kinase PrsK [Pseudomonadota bacterium]
MSGTYSYLLAAVVSLAAGMLLLVKSRNGDIARRASLAAFISVLWAAVLAGQAFRDIHLGWVSMLVEGLRYSAFLTVLRVLAPAATPRWSRTLSLAVCVAPIAYSFAGWMGQYYGLYALPLEGVLRFAGLLLAFVGLVNTEQVVRLTPGKLSRELRMCLIGLGGFFAYDLFLYSQAQLLGELDGVAWALRGLVAATLLAPFTWGVWKMPASEVRVFVSRHVVFYSSAVVAVGIYLSLMAVGGYYVRAHGGGWGNGLQMVFLCGAMGILVSLLLSESPLRRLRVFISTHFYRNKYDYRITWLRFIDTLSSSADEDVRRTVVRAVAQVFSSPGGILFVHDEQARQFIPVAAWPNQLDAVPGLAPVAAASDMVAFIRERQWIIDLKEYRRSPAVYRNIELPRWFAANPALTIVSALLELDRLVGFFVLYEPPPPFDLTYEDRDLLKTVGRHVATQLAQHEADRKLAESRQFEAYNRLTAFMMHDLKNAVAQLGLVVTNAGRHKRNPEFIDDAIGTIANAVDRMTRLIEQLRSTPGRAKPQPVCMDDLVRQAVTRSSLHSPVATLTIASNEPVHVLADAERLAAVFDHVLRNAQDATPAGTVNVALVLANGEVRLEVRDSGVGMDAEFIRERLFRPFDSTKGSKGMGIGAYQVREYVQSVGGHVEVQSSPGDGTAFSIILPLAKAPAAFSS